MDKQKPLWRTGWYWKAFGLYFLVPLNVLCAVLALLETRHYLSPHQFDVITTVVGSMGTVFFFNWSNHQAKKRALQSNS